jgi:signal transduction histidine kinase
MDPARILVLDDNEAALFIKAQILRRADYVVIEARTGGEALAAARTQRPDLAVLDVNLPDMSGFDVCQQLKSEFHTPGIQVLQVSQTAVTEQDRAHGLDVGADMYLIEPFGAPVLLATVRALLRVRRAEDELERALASERAARAEAERANRMKDDFVAMVSHELRTPLNAVTGAIWLLRHGARNQTNYDRAVDVLERNAQVQVQLIEDLLDISRIAAGKLDVKMQPVDLEAVVRNAAEAAAASPAHQRKNISLGVQTAPAIVRGDAARLEQVVSNVLNNAFQFTPSRGRIDVTCGVSDGRAFVRVSDTGTGIDPDVLPHVFERFRQGNDMTSGRERGLGLGLAIVNHLVQRHDGDIALESEGSGKGTTCTITLPLLDQTSAAADSRSNEMHQTLAGLRLLVVEDDADARDVLSLILRGYGADVTEADCGQAAVSVSMNGRFDVLVSDIGLPDLEGGELLKRLRDGGRTISAVAVTAFATEEDRRRLMGQGFEAHVAKPVDPALLAKAVARVAGRR